MGPIDIIGARELGQVLVPLGGEELAVLAEALPRRFKNAEHVVAAVIGIVGAAAAQTLFAAFDAKVVVLFEGEGALAHIAL